MVYGIKPWFVSDITGSRPKLVEIRDSDLKFMEKVGSGGFGSVWKGQWISKKMTVAIKTLVDIDEREVRDLHDSCVVLNIHHLVKYSTIIQD